MKSPLLPLLGGLLLLHGTAGASTRGVLNLSHYDTVEPNFAAIKEHGTLAVIHEATYPPETSDPRYAERAAEATRAGLLWGAYHFANGTDPVRQADRFVDFVHAESAPGAREGGILMVLDFEQNTHYPGGTMSVSQAISFLERVKERTGHYPGLYANENRIRAVLNSPLLTEDERRRLTRTWLWIANYHYEPKAIEPWSKWTLWQYTGDGVCDLPRNRYPISIANMRTAELNLFRGSASDLRQFWRTCGWRPGLD